MVNKEKYIIWSNYDMDFEEWKDGLKENYPDANENELFILMYEINNEYLDDARAMLNKNINNDIIGIASIGRWNGRTIGYKIIKSGNIKDCLYSEYDTCEWYVDSDGEFRCDEYHHDGVNHIYYRKFRNGVNDEDKENLIEAIYNGTANKEDIDRLTDKLGKDIL